MEKKKEGRPSVITRDVVQKLEYAFAMGCSDKEACLYAGIGRTTLFYFEKGNEDFANRKELLKETPILIARQEVLKSLKGNGDLALSFLERRKKDEFSLHQNLNISGAVDLTHHEKKASEMTDDELMAALAQKKA